MNIDSVLKDFIETISILGIKVEGLTAQIKKLLAENVTLKQQVDVAISSMEFLAENGENSTSTYCASRIAKIKALKETT